MPHEENIPSLLMRKARFVRSLVGRRREHTMNAKMTARERMVWEQAVRVLRQNSVTATVSVEPRGAQRVLAKARERAGTQRRG